MKRLIALSLLISAPAFAQPTQEPDPQTQALTQTVIDLTGQNVNLRAQLFALQAEVAKLKKPAPTDGKK